MVLTDGSVITIRYKEPRKLIVLPLDLNSLTEEERKARLERRKPKKTYALEDEIEDDFSVDQYKHLWEKK